MGAHIDILEQRESLRRSLVGSIMLHISVLAAVAVQGIVGERTREQWGHPDSLGGSAVGINAVSQIPLPSRGGPINPLANDTESSVPAPPTSTPQARKAPEPEPDAIPLKARKTQTKAGSRQVASVRTSPLEKMGTRGQLYSETGRALSSPLMGRTGAGGVGMGTGGAFGNRFGYYRDLLEQRIAQHWHTEDVDPRLRTAPPAVVTFVIYRDGSTGDIRIIQSSGDQALDNSALRAIYEASPFQPLPPGYERSEARIEIWFQLKR